jgi:hypothetical protein
MVKGKAVPVLNQAPHHEDVLGNGGIARPGHGRKDNIKFDLR